MDQPPPVIYPSGQGPSSDTSSLSEPSTPIKSGSGKKALIVLLVVILMGASAYGTYYWQQTQVKHLQTTANANSTQIAKLNKQVVKLQASAQAATNLYAGWKTYTSTAEKLSFKYPATWTLKTNPTQTINNVAYDSASITSPLGSTLNWDSGIGGLGGGCDPATSPHLMVASVTPVPAISGLYVVEAGLAGTTPDIGLLGSTTASNPLLKVGDAGCMGYLNFKTSANEQTQDSLSTSGQLPRMASTNGPKAADLPTLKQILLSVSY